jgi:hypothetical protein
MNDIDEKIRRALSSADQKVLDQFGAEPGPFDMVMLSFRSSQWWMAAGIWIFGFALFVLMLFFASRYFAADELKTSLSWGIGILLCGMGLVIMKIGGWQQMQTQVLLREIKRLELRWIASLEK